MEAALVRMLLQSIINGDPSQFDEAEQREAVQWLERQTMLTPRDKGARPQHQLRIKRAAVSLQQALLHWEHGDPTAAKQYAEEALKSF